MGLTFDTAYTISTEADFSSEIHRIVEEQREGALYQLTGNKDIHQGIHQTRRHLKIIRSVWRLIRYELAEEDFQQKNGIYRDAGRQLSALRDLTALLETINRLEKKPLRSMSPAVYRKCRETLVSERDRLQFNPPRLTGAIQEVTTLLREQAPGMDDFSLHADFIPRVALSVRHIYRRGRKCYYRNLTKKTPQTMHEWRKRAKYLRYAFHLIRRSNPTLLKRMEKNLHRLTDLLGNFQNLTLLKKQLDVLDFGLAPTDLKNLSRQVTRRQQYLSRAALTLGEKIYAEKPKTIGKLTEALLQVWKPGNAPQLG